MLMEKARNEIVKYGKMMVKAELTSGTSGNISIFDPNNGYIAITPSGIDYMKLKPCDIVVMDLSKRIIEGNRKPSSESDLHIEIYQKKHNIRAVVHTHSMYCTVMSCLNMPLESVHYVLAESGSNVIPVTRYHTYGTKALADDAVETMGDSKAVLLENHGMVACDEDLKSAYGLASACEWVAEIQYHCYSIGKPNILSKQQMNEVIEKFRTYGQSSKEHNSYFK